MEDVIIIGGGIASHSAAVYTSRAKLKTIVICGFEPDQLSLTTLVENYPGFPEGVLGPELIRNTRKQAEKFGAKYVEAVVTGFEIKKDGYEVKAEGKTYKSETIIISTGAKPRRLDIPGENKYFGRGVSTCAVCDAALYKNKIAVVVGGGDSAMEEALALVKFTSKVYIVHRRDEFRASKIMQDRVLKLKNNIEIIWDSAPTEVLGNKFVEAVKIKNLKTNKETTLKADGMFLAIGHIPNTEIFKGKVELDELGFIKTDRKMHTSLPGVFSAGDVQDHVYKQAVTSAGTGCVAALEAEWHIEKLKAEGKY